MNITLIKYGQYGKVLVKISRADLLETVVKPTVFAVLKIYGSLK